MKDYSLYTFTDKKIQQIWHKALVVFDANVLLDIYRYPSGFAEFLFGLLKHNKLQSKLWLPYQVAEEFARNRVAVTMRQYYLSNLLKIFAKINLIKPNFKISKINQYKNKNVDDIKNAIAYFAERYGINLNHYEKKLEEFLFHSDEKYQFFLDIFNKKIGKKLSHSNLGKIYKEAEDRYLRKIPPGFCDKNKVDNAKYGDYIIWKEILTKARLEKLPIIYVTNENKKDWWHIVGGNKIGARYELQEEFNNYTGQFFLMYTLEGFVINFKKYFYPDLDITKIHKLKEIVNLNEIYSSRNFYFASENIGMPGSEENLWQQLQDNPMLNFIKSELLREYRQQSFDLAKISQFLRYFKDKLTLEEALGRKLKATESQIYKNIKSSYVKLMEAETALAQFNLLLKEVYETGPFIMSL